MFFPIKYTENKNNYPKKYLNKYTCLSTQLVSHSIVEMIDQIVYNRYHRVIQDIMIDELRVTIEIPARVSMHGVPYKVWHLNKPKNYCISSDIPVHMNVKELINVFGKAQDYIKWHISNGTYKKISDGVPSYCYNLRN